MKGSKQSESPEPLTARWTRYGAIFNGILAVTNVAVAMLVAGQLYFLKRQVEDANASTQAVTNQTQQSIDIARHSLAETQNANQAQLRPWVSADVIEQTNLVSDDLSTWTMVVQYENVGKTPALNFDPYGALEVHEYPLASATPVGRRVWAHHWG